MSDLTVKENVIELMSGSKSEREWNDNCDLVKAANNGYPSFWYEEIVLSGLANKVMKRNDLITIHTY